MNAPTVTPAPSPDEILGDDTDVDDVTTDTLPDEEGPEPTVEGTPDDPVEEEDVVLSIAAEIEPPKKMKIRGQDYELYNFDHLTPEQEAKVTALYSRFQRAFITLTQAKKDVDAKESAIRLRRYRERLIIQMTNVPGRVLAKLGPVSQGRLLDVVIDEISVKGTDDDAEEGEDDTQGDDGF